MIRFGDLVGGYHTVIHNPYMLSSTVSSGFWILRFFFWWGLFDKMPNTLQSCSVFLKCRTPSNSIRHFRRRRDAGGVRPRSGPTRNFRRRRCFSAEGAFFRRIARIQRFRIGPLRGRTPSAGFIEFRRRRDDEVVRPRSGPIRNRCSSR